MKEREQMTTACYGVVSGIVASALALAYWFFALNIKPDSSLGISTLGNIKCYVLFVCIFLAVFCICFGFMRICNIKIINKAHLNGGFRFGLLVLTVSSVVPFFKDAWCFPTLITVVIGGVVPFMPEKHS